MRAEIKQLQQAKCSSSYLNTHATSRCPSTKDDQIICRRRNRAWYFPRSCSANLTPGKTNTRFLHAQPHTVM